jgi:hypothetical protein
MSRKVKSVPPLKHAPRGRPPSKNCRLFYSLQTLKIHSPVFQPVTLLEQDHHDRGIPPLSPHRRLAAFFNYRHIQ